MSDAFAKSQKFGRRGVSRGGRTSVPTGFRPRNAAPNPDGFGYASDARDALAAHASAEAIAERFVAKFKLVTLFVGLAILVSGLDIVSDFWGAPAAGAPKPIPLTPFDDQIFLGAGVGLALIGSIWLLKWLLGGRAMVMTDRHVAIFTIVGTRRILWDDISEIKEESSDFFGKELRFYVKWNSPSKGWLMPFVPFYVAVTDTTADDVMAAVRYFRPDL